MKAKAKTSKTGGAKAALDNGAANCARGKGAGAADRRRKAELARRKTRSMLASVPAAVYKWLEGVADKANDTPGEVAAAIVGAFHKFVMEGRATGKTDFPTTNSTSERQDYPEYETRRRPATGKRKERPSTGMKK